MNIESIREYCISKNRVTEELPFGPDTLVFKLQGKIFLLVGLSQVDELCFNVKCEPSYAVELREDYPNTVFAGYHMNKKHWNTVYCNRGLDDKRICTLIDDSYSLIFQSLSRTAREDILRS